MSFFDSEIVRAEMVEIDMLWSDITKNLWNIVSMNREEQKFYVSLLEKYLNKQKILYTRVRLSDDPQAQEWKDNLRNQATEMGLPEDMDINIIFNSMEETVKEMKVFLDRA